VVGRPPARGEELRCKDGIGVQGSGAIGWIA
jgi:hypothetical protein